MSVRQCKQFVPETRNSQCEMSIIVDRSCKHWVKDGWWMVESLVANNLSVFELYFDVLKP